MSRISAAAKVAALIIGILISGGDANVAYAEQRPGDCGYYCPFPDLAPVRSQGGAGWKGIIPDLPGRNAHALTAVIDYLLLLRR